MKANKLILFIIFAVFFASCENELNLEPKQREDASVTLSTESGVTNVLTGAYALAANGNAYGGRILLYADLLGVSGVLNTTDLRWRGSFGELRQMYIKSMQSNNVIIEGTYARCYEIINSIWSDNNAQLAISLSAYIWFCKKANQIKVSQ